MVLGPAEMVAVARRDAADGLCRHAAGRRLRLRLCFLGEPQPRAARAPSRFAALRVLEFCRTVPVLVFALMFVVAFGLGPLPGVLALAIHTAGALGKLFAEVVENIDIRPAEGVRACGGNWLRRRSASASLPQVLSSFVSYTLLRFEINVREADRDGLRRRRRHRRGTDGWRSASSTTPTSAPSCVLIIVTVVAHRHRDRAAAPPPDRRERRDERASTAELAPPLQARHPRRCPPALGAGSRDWRWRCWRRWRRSSSSASSGSTSRLGRSLAGLRRSCGSSP